MIRARPRDPVPVFSGIPSFCRLPLVERSALSRGMVAIAGIAFDATCTGRIGSRFGPRAIRETSQYFAAHAAAGDALIETFTKEVMAFPNTRRVVDIDDLNVYPHDVIRTENAVAESVSELVAHGVTPVLLGGDEYLALPVLRGFVEAIGDQPVGYISLSAHWSLGDRVPRFDRYWGGAVARRIIESGSVVPERMAWVGISGRCRGEEWDYAREIGCWSITAEALRHGGVGTGIRRALEKVAPNGEPVFVALDMSVVDGAYAAGTSRPSFDGLTNVELLEAIDSLGNSASGLLLTGVNPEIEPTWTTERLATIAVLRLLARRHLKPSRPLATAGPSRVVESESAGAGGAEKDVDEVASR